MKRYAVALAAVVAIAIAIVALREGSRTARVDGDRRDTSSASDRFFADYVTSDGRVVRHDQGGDTVSEGQAYAMQLAVERGDAERFQSTWRWTQAHLQRDDGLLAWRWVDGHVADDQPATDADIDAAVALLRAADRFGRSDYRDEARRIAAAAADHETFTAAGRTLPAAGPWAVADRIVNPSYLAPCEYDDLVVATGDARWQQLHDSALAVLRDTLDRGLPPDWAVIGPDGSIKPIAGPDDRAGAGRYGLDAARVPARLAGCDEGRTLARQLWPRLQALDGGGAGVAYSLDGQRLDGASNPLGLIAAAIAAGASGDGADASTLFTRAEAQQRAHATYYGAAWLALGEQILDDLNAPVHTTAASGGKALLLRSVGLVPDQVSPSSTDPANGVDATTTAAPTTTAPTTAAPTTTVATTTTATATTAVSTTTSPTATTVSSASTSTTAVGSSAPSTSVAPNAPSTSVAPNAPTPTDATDGAGDAPSSSAQPPHASGEPSSSDDVFSPSASDATLPGRAEGKASARSPAERARRRTAGVTIGGFTGTALLGATMGLRERRITRRRRSG